MSADHIVCAFNDITSGAAQRFVIGDLAIAVVRIDDNVYAIGDLCSHAEVSLSEGTVLCKRRELECGMHFSAFSLVTGVPSTLPATTPVPVYAAKVVDGNVVVTVTQE